jgi:hypothetical protein
MSSPSIVRPRPEFRLTNDCERLSVIQGNRHRRRKFTFLIWISTGSGEDARKFRRVGNLYWNSSERTFNPVGVMHQKQ